MEPGIEPNTITNQTAAPTASLWNWKIQQLFVAREFQQCLALADKVLTDTDRQCVFALYIKGLTLQVSIRKLGSLFFFAKFGIYLGCFFVEICVLLNRKDQTTDGFNQRVVGTVPSCRPD